MCMRRIAPKMSVSILAAMMCIFTATEMFAVVDSNSICIVENGEAKAVIVLAKPDAISLTPDVQLLVRCIEKSTGAVIPVGGASAETNSIEIHIGNTEY